MSNHWKVRSSNKMQSLMKRRQSAISNLSRKLLKCKMPPQGGAQQFLIIYRLIIVVRAYFTKPQILNANSHNTKLQIQCYPIIRAQTTLDDKTELIKELGKHVESLESQIEQQKAECDGNVAFFEQQLEQKATEMQNAASRRVSHNFLFFLRNYKFSVIPL